MNYLIEYYPYQLIKLNTQQLTWTDHIDGIYWADRVFRTAKYYFMKLQINLAKDTNFRSAVKILFNMPSKT